MALLSKIKYPLLCLVPFLMCIYPFMAAWPIIGFIICWLAEGDFKRKGQAIVSNKYVWLFVGFYLVNVLGLLYANDYQTSLFRLQIKLSMLVFPLLLVSEGEKSIKEQKMFIYTFIAACVLNGLICLGYAIYNLVVNNVFVFQYIQFSIMLHPSYYSMYIDVAILFVFYLFTSNKVVLSKLEKYFLLFSVFFLLAILALLQSKMGMFISAGLVLVLLIRYSRLHNFKTSIWLSGITLIVFFSTSHFLVGGRSRVIGAEDIIKSKQISDSSTESTQVRYYVWKAAVAVIKQHPVFGVGVGNESKYLVAQYLKDGYTGAAKEKLNAHNQYLQTTVISGVIGLVVLILGFLFPFIKCIKEKRFVYGTLLVILALNFLVEAMLEQQSGTIFYGLFNSLLMFNFVI